MSPSVRSSANRADWRYRRAVIVRCTARLLKLLAPGELADVSPAPDDWYANLIWIDLNAFLRRTPYKRNGYFRPIDAARQR